MYLKIVSQSNSGGTTLLVEYLGRDTQEAFSSAMVSLHLTNLKLACHTAATT